MKIKKKKIPVSKKKTGIRKKGLSLKGASATYVIIIMFMAFAAAFTLIGGRLPSSDLTTKNVDPVIVNMISPEQPKNNLQLYTFTGATVTPTQPPPPPVPVPPKGNVCISNPFNEEPDIFVGSIPPAGGVASASAQIVVWIDDGQGGSVAPGTKADPATGRITTTGDRTAHDGRGSNYYLWEPAIYITPLTTADQPGPYAGDAENGGKPYFPIIVKGSVNYAEDGATIKLPPADNPAGYTKGSRKHGGYLAQYIWDVPSMGITTKGFHRVQYVVHDGDGDLAINCTTLQL